MPKKENESNLLTAMIGSIKTKEEASKIQVNCRPEDGDPKGDTQTGLENVELSVLFPEVAAKDKVVPLNGGSIVKLDLTAGSEFSWKDSEKNIGRYGDPIAKLAAYVKSEIPHVSTDEPEKGKEKPFVSVSNLAKARVAVNKALGDMPQLSSTWHKHGVPTLVLSKTKTSKYETTADLQKALDKDKKTRIGDLNKPVGYFKFIPPQVLSQIFDALMNAPADDKTPNEYGMWNGAYYGISGESFHTMAKQLQVMVAGGEWDEKFIIKTLLDLFPIFKVKSSDITGGANTLPTIGYYTACKQALYIKMPDLSGRDSNGDSQNIYGVGSDVKGNIKFCFELVKDVYKYAAKAFDFAPPPVLSVKERDAEYPGFNEGETPKNPSITILKEGIDKELFKKYKFFLSPILPAGSNTSTRGLKTTALGTEIFTAPILTAPYLDANDGQPVVSYPPKVVSKLIYEFSKKLQTGGMTGYNKVFNDTTDMTKQKESESARDDGKLEYLEFADKIKNPSKDKHRYKFEELGLPMSENLAVAGVDSVIDVLGEANRPELLLGFRDGQAPEPINESKVYDPKICGAKTLLASIRPNIITDLEKLSQLPANWIPLTISTGKAEDDFYTLEIPFSQGSGPGPKSSLDIYNSLGLLTFALYAVDNMGQIVRAPGQNIRITPLTPNISKASPDGFAGGAVIGLATKLAPSALLAIEEDVITGLTITGEGFVGMHKEISINFYRDEAGKDLITSVRHGQKFGVNQNELRVRDIDDKNISIEMKGNFGDILPALVGTFYLAVQLPSGATSKTVPFLISKAGTKPPDLPAPGDIKIKFKDSFGIEVEGFGKAVHSIPVIQDAVNHASISLKTKKKTFDTSNTKAILYAYIAVLANDHNKDILLSDVGWMNDDDHKEKSILKKTIVTSISKDTEFYIPTAIEWTYGSGDFKRDDGRKAVHLCRLLCIARRYPSRISPLLWLYHMSR